MTNGDGDKGYVQDDVDIVASRMSKRLSVDEDDDDNGIADGAAVVITPKRKTRKPPRHQQRPMQRLGQKQGQR